MMTALFSVALRFHRFYDIKGCEENVICALGYDSKQPQ